MSQKVMIVEDESIVAMELTSYVSSLGYEVIGRVSSGEDACKLIAQDVPDVILMDVHIKGDIDGISLAQKVQEKYEVSIIYITAFNDDESIERAIATDPSAYLAKPFNRKELAASLKIAFKRRVQSDSVLVGNVKIDHEFSYDTNNRELICCGTFVHLTPKEKELLALLLEADHQVVDIYTIENQIWPGKPTNENTRRSLIGRLRTKLKYQFVETLSGQGYRLRY